MNRIHLVIAFIALVAAGLAPADVTQKDLDACIDRKALRHPYLFFSESDKPAIRKRIETDRECRDGMRQLLAKTNRLLAQPVDREIPVQGKNTRAGWSEHDRDNRYERYYASNLDNAFTLAFVYQMTDDGKYAEKAFEFADAFCDLPTWTMRPHEFPVIYSRIMPWNVPDDQVCFSFDHFNGDAGRTMALVYDWLYPALDRRQRDRIRGSLIEKVITRVRGNYEYHWWAVAYRCNWCGVCNSGVGMSGLALLTEHPELTDVAAESCNRITRMLDQLDTDGGWQEGCGYWSYALRTSVQYAEALKRLTRQKYNLFLHPKLRANPVTFPLTMSVSPGRCVNFEDSGSKVVGPTFLFNKLAAETGDPRAVWYRHNLLGEGEDILDLLWPRPAASVPPPLRASLHFRDIGFWVMRSDFTDSSKVLVAGKAGKNDDPHHGHLDVGHVSVFWQGRGYLCDIGRSPYDEKYFDNARWDYPHASSEGHNVVFVNGEKQLPGKLYKQPWNGSIGGKVLEFRSDADQDYVLMDPANAYPKVQLKGWRRHVVLSKPEVTVILDEIRCRAGDEIEARFHSECDIRPLEKAVLLEGKQGLMALVPLVQGPFSIRQDRHAFLPVNATAAFSWIPYFGVVLTAKTETTVVGLILLPVRNEAEAKEIADAAMLSKDRSGNVVLSFTRRDRSFQFHFRSKEGGLVLEK